MKPACISYKIWKKCKQVPNDTSKDLLVMQIKQQAQYAHYCFKTWYKHLYTNRLRCMCFPVNKAYSKKDLYAFAQINATCLRKVCKRLDKRIFRDNTACTWFTQNRHELSFCSGAKYTKLTLDVLGIQDDDTCPICLDKVSELAIMKCGHFVCMNCFMNMYNVKNKKGTLHNIVRAQDYVQPNTCPMCRQFCPFRNFEAFAAASNNMQSCKSSGEEDSCGSVCV